MSDPFYSSSGWLKLRKLILARDRYICQACGKSCTERKEAHVDHIIDRADRPDLERDLDNLQVLCAGCHSRKTRRGDNPRG